MRYASRANNIKNTPKVNEDPNLVDFYTNYRPWETEDSVEVFKGTLYDEAPGKKEKKAW